MACPALRRLVFPLILAMAACPFATAQKDEESNPIDTRWRECAARNPSTFGERDCAAQAEKEWDGELNRAYRKLQTTVSAEGKARLVKAQVAWIAYRDAEIRLIESLYDVRDGSMFIPVQGFKRAEIVRARARELARYVSRHDGG